MVNIKITADSTCDLNQELTEKFGIDIFPQIVNLGEKTERDTPDLPEKIYAYVEKTKTTPKTSASSTEEYKEFFTKYKPENGTLIHFTISSELSVANANAVKAAEQFENVFVIDSRMLATGIGILVVKACQLRDQGLSAKEIIEKINEYKEKVTCSFVIKDLTYLHRGGRCSATTKLFAIALGIKPQIIMKDGKMIAGKKYMGNYDLCVKKYIADTLALNPNPDLDYCFIVHTKMDNKNIVETVRKQILEKFPFKNIVEIIASGSITTHSGPNTLGIVFAQK